jgi:hypothetical protein
VLRNRILIGARVVRASHGPTAGSSTDHPSKVPKRRRRLSVSTSPETGAFVKGLDPPERRRVLRFALERLMAG